MLRPPQLDKYEKKEQLGSGNFATVHIFVDKSSGKRYAGKIINKAKCPAKFLASEIKIMQELNNPHCVLLHEYFETDDKAYLVMELMTGGELFDRIEQKGNYTERDAATTFKTVIEAIQYLHNNYICHRDLKPENLLLTDTSEHAALKVSDFGFAVKVVTGDESLLQKCGSPGYMAPEILNYSGYGRPVDVFALGVILYIMLCGYPPWPQDSPKPDLQFHSPEWDTISNSAKELVTWMLAVEARNRPSAKEVLAHPWVHGAGNEGSLVSMLPKLKEFNAKRRFKAGILKMTMGLQFANIAGKLKLASAAASAAAEAADTVAEAIAEVQPAPTPAVEPGAPVSGVTPAQPAAHPAQAPHPHEHEIQHLLHTLSELHHNIEDLTTQANQVLGHMSKKELEESDDVISPLFVAMSHLSEVAQFRSVKKAYLDKYATTNAVKQIL